MVDKNYFLLILFLQLRHEYGDSILNLYQKYEEKRKNRGVYFILDLYFFKTPFLFLLKYSRKIEYNVSETDLNRMLIIFS